MNKTPKYNETRKASAYYTPNRTFFKNNYLNDTTSSPRRFLRNNGRLQSTLSVKLLTQIYFFEYSKNA